MKIGRRTIHEARTPTESWGKSEMIEAARDLDAAIRCEVEAVKNSLGKLAAMLVRMKEEHLWVYLVNEATNETYHRFDEYVCSVTGDEISHTKLYDLLAIGRLGIGRNPVPPETVEKLGRIKAAEVARLDPEERTPELLQEFVDHSVPIVRQRVQDIVNKKLPPRGA